MEKDIIIVTNGPGELVSWVTPVVSRIKARFSESRIIIALVPCRFATGSELGYASNIPGVNSVLTTKETFRLMRKKVLLNQRELSKEGVVLFLGGDPFWAYLLAKRLNYKSIHYSEKKHDKRFDFSFNRANDGDLMIDAFDQESKSGEIDRVENITFFPGSRVNHFRRLIPFYKEIVKNLKNDQLQFNIGISPFIKREVLNGVTANIELSDFTILREEPNKVFEKSDYLVTIPGTNTAQAAVASVPCCVLVPLNNPEEIPLEGLAGLVGNLPIIGNLVKRIAIDVMKKKIKYTALPNIKANKKIIPELVGDLDAKEVADFIRSQIKDVDNLRQYTKEAKEVMGDGGVADKILAAVETILVK